MNVPTKRKAKFSAAEWAADTSDDDITLYATITHYIDVKRRSLPKHYLRLWGDVTQLF